MSGFSCSISRGCCCRKICRHMLFVSRSLLAWHLLWTHSVCRYAQLVNTCTVYISMSRSRRGHRSWFGLYWKHRHCVVVADELGWTHIFLVPLKTRRLFFTISTLFVAKITSRPFHKPILASLTLTFSNSILITELNLAHLTSLIQNSGLFHILSEFDVTSMAFNIKNLWSSIWFRWPEQTAPQALLFTRGPCIDGAILH